MIFLYFFFIFSTSAKSFDLIEYGSPQHIDLMAKILGFLKPNQDFIFESGCPSNEPDCRSDTLTESSHF